MSKTKKTMGIMATKWLCRKCYDNFDGSIEMKLIPDAFTNFCTFCGKLADYLVVIKEEEEAWEE